MSSGGREIREGAISTVNPGLNEEEEEKPKERRESVRTVVYVYAEANGVKERERDGIFPWRVQPRGKGMSTSTDQIRDGETKRAVRRPPVGDNHPRRGSEAAGVQGLEFDDRGRSGVGVRGPVGEGRVDTRPRRSGDPGWKPPSAVISFSSSIR